MRSSPFRRVPPSASPSEVLSPCPRAARVPLWLRPDLRGRSSLSSRVSATEGRDCESASSPLAVSSGALGRDLRRLLDGRGFRSVASEPPGPDRSLPVCAFPSALAADPDEVPPERGGRVRGCTVARSAASGEGTPSCGGSGRSPGRRSYSVAFSAVGAPSGRGRLRPPREPRRRFAPDRGDPDGVSARSVCGVTEASGVKRLPTVESNSGDGTDAPRRGSWDRCAEPVGSDMRDVPFEEDPGMVHPGRAANGWARRKTDVRHGKAVEKYRQKLRWWW